jgi:hypothetical protein
VSGANENSRNSSSQGNDFSRPNPTHRASRGPPSPFRGGMPRRRLSLPTIGQPVERFVAACTQPSRRTVRRLVCAEQAAGIPPRNGEGGPREARWVGMQDDCTLQQPIFVNARVPRRNFAANLVAITCVAFATTRDRTLLQSRLVKMLRPLQRHLFENGRNNRLKSRSYPPSESSNPDSARRGSDRRWRLEKQPNGQ